MTQAEEGAKLEEDDMEIDYPHIPYINAEWMRDWTAYKKERGF